MTAPRLPLLPLAAGVVSALVLLPAMVEGAADDDWPDAFDEPDLMELTSRVNDGELAFLDPAAAEGAHVHMNHVVVTAGSLDDGWVSLEQCHEHLDAVPAAQILFRAGGIRDLTITASDDIGRAWVDGHSVQLENVGTHARLCVRGKSRALIQLGDGHYRLRNGPYLRRFLDGFYPMRVSLSIDYPAERLRLVGQSPPGQPGFDVSEQEGRLDIDATFEGRLVTCFDFCDRTRADCDEAMVVACAAGGGPDAD